MNKYYRLMDELEKRGEGKMKCFGNSMIPLIKSGSMVIFQKTAQYEIGDKVFCKVRGRFIDCHLILKIDAKKGYLIGNNHGFENGWTKTIYGYAASAS